MRNLVLVALVLQLVLTEATEELQFGDIISFERKLSSYKHFAVYVGDMDLPGKQAGQDIFHRTGPKKAIGDCGFGVLEKERGVGAKDNFLDECFPGQMGTEAHHAQMKERISHWNDKANCGTYSLHINNCEHLATYVRYNYPCSLQEGTAAGHFRMTFSQKDCGKIVKTVKDMEENERHRKEFNNKISISPTMPLLICFALVCVFLFVKGRKLFRRHSPGETLTPPPVAFHSFDLQVDLTPTEYPLVRPPTGLTSRYSDKINHKSDQ